MLSFENIKYKINVIEKCKYILIGKPGRA